MKRKLTEKQRGLLMLFAAVAVTMVLLFPLYWMLTTAVRIPGEAFSNPTFFPQHISLDAFRFTSENGITLDVFFLNSVIVSWVQRC